MRSSWFLLLTLAALGAGASGCATSRAAHDRRALAAQDALAALRSARFDDATAQSTALIAADPENASARGIAALAVYQRTLHELVTHAVGFLAQAGVSAMLRGGFIDTGYITYAVDAAENGLAEVDRHLAAAATDPYFSLELCLACWEVDWNRNGEVDDRDRRLLEVEVDAQLRPLPEGDPRRRPTFHFDLADVHWLRALVSFQRSVGQLLRAYDFSEAGKLVQRHPPPAVFRLKDKARVAAAKALLLTGLDEAERTRALVLAETDDDREWLPNPRQLQHPLPFPVDEALFETWAGVLAEVRGLVEGRTGVPLDELTRVGRKSTHGAAATTSGFADLGKMLNDPGDVVFDLNRAQDNHGDAAGQLQFLRQLLGWAYRAQMPATPLFERISRMRGEIDRGEDTFERKLRYLLWLN